MRLSHRDFDRLQRTIGELHDLDRADTFEQAAPALFSKIIPADWFAHADCDVDAPRKRVTVLRWESSPLITADLIRRLEYLAFDHPFSKYSLATGDRTALKLSDFYPQAQLLRTELYNEAYRHLDTGRFLATACFNPRGLTTLNAGRSMKRGDFTERDRLVMNLLRPHFEIARRTAELNDARAAAKAMPLESYRLTPREREVAAWLVRGKTSPEISTILSVRPRTVEKHVEHILEKTGTESRTAAALLIANAPRES